jgi:hypothetical protein
VNEFDDNGVVSSAIMLPPMVSKKKVSIKLIVQSLSNFYRMEKKKRGESGRKFFIK